MNSGTFRSFTSSSSSSSSGFPTIFPMKPTRPSSSTFCNRSIAVLASCIFFASAFFTFAAVRVLSVPGAPDVFGHFVAGFPLWRSHRFAVDPAHCPVENLAGANITEDLHGSIGTASADTSLSTHLVTRAEAGFDSRKGILLSLWDGFLKEDGTPSSSGGKIPHDSRPINFPRPPHLENCSEKAAEDNFLDNRNKDGSPPSWLLWKGKLRLLQPKLRNNSFNSAPSIDVPRPPWVEGADGDNFPMTRQVQRDLWLHQHPKNCSDPQLRFLWADWETKKRLGLGGLITSIAGLLSIAIRENRILVTDYFSRADHAGCVGAGHARWECYFLPATSAECKRKALELASQPDAWKKKVITTNGNYTTRDIWFGAVPDHWGNPWDYMQPTSEVDGKLLVQYSAKDRRWWRAQAVRYLMRFPTAYTCRLMNHARHQSFGSLAAEMMLKTLPKRWPKVTIPVVEGDMERYVWRNQKPWIPRPMTSVHVRLGDKASEMKMVGFKGYMDLAFRVRSRFPDANNIWLSTEMQDVIDESKTYEGWNFYYTNVTRQFGSTSMIAYEGSLGKEASTTNAIVNFLMASNVDFFIGALGSTWCSLIDGMRSTSGLDMVGYLSVNKDRFW